MTNARKLLPTTLLVIMGMLILPSAPALAANGHGLINSFGSETSTVKDPEPLSAPTGIAWSRKTEEVYVIDAGHNRVERFSATGTYEGQFKGSETPAKAFSSPNAIAVDDDPGSPSYGDVYVSDSGHAAIDKFTSNGIYTGYRLTEETTGVSLGELKGVAVDPSGNLWVEDNFGGIDEFNNATNNSFVLSGSPESEVTPGIAVDSNDNVYIVSGFYHNVWKFVPGKGVEFFAGGFEGCGCVTGVAVDPATNNVYADRGKSASEYPPFPVEGAAPEEFGSGALTKATGIAVSATHTVYIADSTANDVDVFEEGPKPEPPVTGTGTVEGLSATLEGKLEGGETSYHFAYNTNGTCTGASTTPVLAATGTGKVSVKITGLTAKTKYTYCLLAEDNYGHETGSPETIETTRSVPVVEETSSSVMNEVNATLNASVNPELEPSTCVFQYGKSETYEHETPCEPKTLGEGSTGVPVTANLTGLQPDTTYDYRVLASNATGKQPGANETFTTEPITPTQVETAPATNVTPTTAKLGGQANPGGSATYYIEYGPPTCSLNGNPNFAWWLCATKSTEAGPLSGNTVQKVTPIEVGGLTPATTYRYWIVAHNINGSERGEEATFTTPPATPIVPSVLISSPPVPQPQIIPPPPVITPKVTITATSVKNNTLIVSIRTTVAGTITITGPGLSKITRTLTAGTHKLTIALSKTRKKNIKNHKKITLQVTLKAGQNTVSMSKAVKL